MKLSTWVFPIYVLIPLIGATPVFFLTEGILRVPLTVVQACIILAIALSFTFSEEYKLKCSIAIRAVDYLVLAAVLALGLVVLFLDRTYVSCGLAALVVSFVPGYSVARVLGFEWKHSAVELVAVSYAVSIPITSLLVLMLLPVILSSWALSKALMLVLFALFAVAPLVKETIVRKSRSSPTTSCKIAPVEAFVLGLLFCVFVIAILATYLQMDIFNSIIGSDIARHLSATVILLRTPELYLSPYPFFHLYQASVMVLSSAPIDVMQITLAFLGFVNILSFYAMAKSYLGHIHRNAAVVATAFWAVLAGFGWVYVAFVTLVGNLDLQTAMRTAFGMTYNDVYYGLGMDIWLWYRPLLVAFTLVFSLLYLLRRLDLPTLPMISLSTIIIVGLFFVHVPELIALGLVFLASALFLSRRSLQFLNISKSLLIATVLVFVVWYGLEIRHIAFSLPFYILVGFGCISLLFAGVVFLNRHIYVPNRLQVVVGYATLVVFAGFLAGIPTWAAVLPAFSYADVYLTLFVPWFFYPALLGVGGVLAFLEIRQSGLSKSFASTTFPVVILFALTPIIGRCFSIFNILFFDPGYWERRFVYMSFAGAALLSSMFLFRLQSITDVHAPRLSRTRVHLKPILTLGLVAIVFSAGSASTFISISYWANRKPYLTPSEISDIQVLQAISAEYPTTPILTVTGDSRIVLDLAAAARLLRYPDVWGNRLPEIPLMLFYDRGYPSPFFYLQPRDLDVLASRYSSGYFGAHFEKSLTPVASTSSPWLLSALPAVSPVPISDAVLVVPHNSTSPFVQYCYDLLSFGFRNYSTLDEYDRQFSAYRTVVYSEDVNSSGDLQRILELASGGKTVIVFCSNGYSEVAKLFLKSAALQLSVTSPNATCSIHLVDDYATALGSINISAAVNPLDMVIDLDETNINSTVVSEDAQTSLWLAEGLGSGGIGIPILTDDSSLVISGNDSLSVTLPAGSYESWRLVRLVGSENWASKYFLSFYWYGVNDGRAYRAELWAPDANNRFSYEFRNTWSGWRRIVLPLKMPLGESAVGRVPITKRTFGSPSWEAISRIQLLPNATTASQIGDHFHLDRMAVDDSRIVELTGRLVPPTRNATLVVSAYGANGYAPLFTANWNPPLNLTLPSSLLFLDNTTASSLYGPVDAGWIALSNGQGDSVQVQIRMPIDTLRDSLVNDISQCRLRFGFLPNLIQATRLQNSTSSINLEAEVDAILLNPLQPSYVQSNYSDGIQQTPLFLQRDFGIGRLCLLNTKSIFDKADASQLDFVRIFSKSSDIWKLIGSPLSSRVPGSVIPSSFLTIQTAVFEGEVCGSCSSIFFDPNRTIETAILVLPNETIHVANLTYLSVDGASSISFSATRGVASGGLGFYAGLVLDNVLIEVTGENVTILWQQNGLGMNGRHSVGHLSIGCDGTSVSLFGRQPHIECVGQTGFYSCYAYGEYSKTLRAFGNDLFFYGQTSLDVSAADFFILGQSFGWNGAKAMNPPIVACNEFYGCNVGLFWTMAFLGAAVLLPVLSRHFFARSRPGLPSTIETEEWSQSPQADGDSLLG